ncbi:hypothetical protein [Aeromicrobium ginsengisoli]|uniref:Uncharacterized protein n=1 Tax=Aeromicrobium ginsengisoli TaxID=363867 RepID=A0A5M4FJF0_9ACTN|nr:hypothetical protein [Aeromicrobium ginsengisoli]KAA1399725.1 hypothetical protein ESP70_002900 [Aeromicrobium ginsengisoli]
MSETDPRRESLLRSVWQEILATTPDTVRNLPAAGRAIDAGAQIDDMVTAMRAASYETAHRLLYLIALNHGPDDEAGEHGWALVPFDQVNEVVDLTEPNPLDGVSEDLLESDPSGRGAEDLWN